MKPTLINPATLHDPVPFGYSHVAHADGGSPIYVAGQYGSGPDGHVVSDRFEDQVRTAFDNLELALAAVGLETDDVVRLGTYIVVHSPERLEVVGAQLARIWGSNPPAQTMLGVASLALPGMLFEVDAVAVRRSQTG